MRIIPLMLVLVLVVSLVGCGKNKDEDVPTAGDYSFQANEQYTFDGIEGDVSVTSEDGSSDTDSTGRVYNNKNYGNSGSYGGGSYKNPGYVQTPDNGGNKNNGGNSGNNNNGGNNNNNNSDSRYTLSELLAKVGDVKTYEEAIRKLNAMGIYPDKIIDGALKQYYDSLTKPTTTMSESKKNELESKFDDIINGIRPTKAPTTAPAAE